MASDPNDIAETIRRSGIDNASTADLAILRAHFARVDPAERVRLCIYHGDSLAETAVDRVWSILDRRPTRAEYTEIAALFREAMAYCEKEAKEVR
jgi:hypothetical protein